MSVVNTSSEGMRGLVKAIEIGELNKVSRDGKQSPEEITQADVVQPGGGKPENSSFSLVSSDQADQEKEVEEEVSRNEEAPILKEKDFPVIKDAIEKINDYMASLERDLEFNFDKNSGRTIVKVIDKSTNEVVRVLPPEEAVSIAEGIKSGVQNIGAIIDLET